MARTLSLALCLAAIFLFPALADFAVLSSLQSTSGSLAGGSYLVIWGQGFNRGGKAGSTQVYLGTRSCTVVPYYSTDNKLVCYTPPSPVEQTVTVFVQLVYFGVSSSSYARCEGTCTYTYRSRDTPSIFAASLGGTAGSVLRFYGNGNALLGPTTRWYNIHVGDRQYGLTCDANANVQVPGIPRVPGSAMPSEDNLLNFYSQGVVKCVAPPSEAGRYNVTFEVRDPALGAIAYGEAARPTRQGKQALPPPPGAPPVGGGVEGVTCTTSPCSPPLRASPWPPRGCWAGGPSPSRARAFPPPPGATP